jgi:hypothetical protein
MKSFRERKRSGWADDDILICSVVFLGSGQSGTSRRHAAYVIHFSRAGLFPRETAHALSA